MYEIQESEVLCCCCVSGESMQVEGVSSLWPPLCTVREGISFLHVPLRKKQQATRANHN